MVPIKFLLVLIVCIAAFVAPSESSDGNPATRNEILSKMQLAIVKQMRDIVNQIKSAEVDLTTDPNEISKSIFKNIFKMMGKIAEGVVGVAHSYGFKPSSIVERISREQADTTTIDHSDGTLVTGDFDERTVDILPKVKLAIAEGILNISRLYESVDVDPTIGLNKMSEPLDRRILEIVWEMYENVGKGVLGVFHVYGFKPPGMDLQALESLAALPPSERKNMNNPL